MPSALGWQTYRYAPLCFPLRTLSHTPADLCTAVNRCEPRHSPRYRPPHLLHVHPQPTSSPSHHLLPITSFPSPPAHHLLLLPTIPPPSHHLLLPITFSCPPSPAHRLQARRGFKGSLGRTEVNNHINLFKASNGEEIHGNLWQVASRK